MCQDCAEFASTLRKPLIPGGLVLSWLATMSTVVIGADVLDLLRDGLRSQIALAAQHVASADEQPDGQRYPERYQDPLRYQDALRALLEEIGWSGSIDPP